MRESAQRINRFVKQWDQTADKDLDQLNSMHWSSSEEGDA